MNQEYQYDAGLVDPNLWMVKRWKTDRRDYSEALIRVETADPKVAIAAAIERGSWA